jgi:fructokinase
MEFPRVQADDIVLFGSIYAITKEIRARLVQFISTSAKNGAIVIYDPNFRTAHAPGLARLKPLILENMQMSAIVRGSDEDFRNIFQAESPDSAWSVVGNYSPCLVYTASADAVYVRTAGFSGMFPVRKITPVSTIGAGDNFNAGMIAAIYRAGIKKDELEMMGEEVWHSVITAGMDFATDVCMSYENYISRELAGKYRGGT